MSIAPLKVDVEQVLFEKSSGSGRKIPRFIINYLKRIIHEDEINDFLSKHGHKVGIDFTGAVLEYMNLKVELAGLQNISQHQRYTFASNHPLGGLDGIALLNTLAVRFKDVKAMANDILMSVKNMEPFFMPVNKHGAQAKSFIETINKAYESDAQITIFPAGLVSRRTKGIIKDIEWKKNFVSKSIRYKRDIVPVHISGRNSNFFYNLANLRKLLRVKTNIEMLFLPNEMFKFRNQQITITFGEPIPFQTFTRDNSPKQWAAVVKNKVYELAK